MGIHAAPAFRGIAIGALLLTLQFQPTLASACEGADPAVVSVSVKEMQTNGRLNHYTLVGKIVNLGSAAQPSNTLQFVDIYKGSTKLDSRGVPPLEPGQSYVFEYLTTRSAQAGKGTTALAFRIDVRRPMPAAQACSTGNGVTMVRF